jgi:hypothetical protein
MTNATAPRALDQRFDDDRVGPTEGRSPEMRRDPDLNRAYDPAHALRQETRNDGTGDTGRDQAYHA